MNMRRIDIDDDGVDIGFDHRLLYAGEPYTGEAEEHLAGHLVSRVTYADGFRDGPYREWYKDGTLSAEGVMRRGFVSGESNRWHPNGVLAQRMINSEDGRTPLAAYEWDEEGRPTRAWKNTSPQG
jgi:antitoxin component YwqK of YwqJK toxin-antitoxin module